MRRWCVSRSLPSMSYKKESLSDVRLHSAARQGNVMDLRHLLESGKVHTDSRDKVKIKAEMLCTPPNRYRNVTVVVLESRLVFPLRYFY